MMGTRKYIKFLGMFIMALGISTHSSCRTWQSKKWIAYYGNGFKPEHLKGLDLVIVDPDSTDHALFTSGTKTVRIAYISVGEAEEYRYFWKHVKKDWIVDQNKIWKSYRIDIRKTGWQKLLLDTVIPDILKKGYNGLLLDTVDTAVDLEETDQRKYSGSKKAMVAFIKSIRAKYPNIWIIPNNGLKILMEVGHLVNGVMVEDLYTSYNFDAKRSDQTPAKAMLEKEQILDAFRQSSGNEVFNILYETNSQSKLSKFAIKRSESKKYSWYLTTVDLAKTKVGVVPGLNYPPKKK